MSPVRRRYEGAVRDGFGDGTSRDTAALRAFQDPEITIGGTPLTHRFRMHASGAAIQVPPALEADARPGRW
jgi:hypothetical protein